jgi:hypothetical protein
MATYCVTTQPQSELTKIDRPQELPWWGKSLNWDYFTDGSKTYARAHGTLKRIIDMFTSQDNRYAKTIDKVSTWYEVV